ncbi:hypothetical protein CA13_18300 [Planctomycetes bacterium CA13]|uniref:Uncharacterized protein n=1 Tax=Novipirellula herctigrandis TaxID=2527986 RepID=A0A5C5YZE6_9BACT|nr:hypothetical protein CA13_18300 [Planctomycetes bacterium CA13]
MQCALADPLPRETTTNGGLVNPGNWFSTEALREGRRQEGCPLSSDSTSGLPNLEELFEQLLAWTSKRCEEVSSEAWLFHGRIVEMVDGHDVRYRGEPRFIPTVEEPEEGIHCHLIGINLMRCEILVSALRFSLSPSRPSFTGAMQAMKEFASSLRLGSVRGNEQWGNLLEVISERGVGNRPDRQEKRELKRRQKSYRLMTCPRKLNRNRYTTAA